MNVKYRAHETFFIRKGWLTKGIKNVLIDSAVFISRDTNPMDTLGIGANMVKALRYWLQAVGLTEEHWNGRRIQKLTRLGEIIHENDPYMEELGTLWLLHYKLATNKEEATAWYFFFNEFRAIEFTRDDFITQTDNFLRDREGIELGEDLSLRSVEDDYSCIMNTYIPRIRFSPKKFDPEDNIDCPLGELGLIDIVNKKDKVFKKSSPKKDTLHPLILLAVILEQYEKHNPNWRITAINDNEKREIRISEIQNNTCNAGKVFNLDIIALTTLLYRLELLKFVKVVRTAGLDIIKIETDFDFLDCVQEYYRIINR
jgi:hypothetical protein